MNDKVVLIHGTAIQIGRCGLVFLGPSGAGKSMLAFTCLTEARQKGLRALLVADDQILVHLRDGELVAEAPASIAGLMELRGTGILRMDHAASAALHHAVLPGFAKGENRIPSENERYPIKGETSLPVTRLLANNPVPLATLLAFRPDVARLCL